MNIVFWIVTGITALAFFAAGIMKLTQPKEKLEPQMKQVADFDGNTIKGIGLLEVLGGLGLILLHLSNILPWLSVAAAVGLILTMIGGAVVHIRRKESIVPNIVLGLLSAVALFGATQS